MPSPYFVNAPVFAAGIDTLLVAALHRIPRHKSASKSRYFKGLVFPLKAGNKPAEDDW
jgi:hypothetical protein